MTNSHPVNFYQSTVIKQEFPTAISQPLDIELEDLEGIDFKGIEKLVGQPLTPEVLNFDDNILNVNQLLTPYQYLQSFSANSGFQNYPGIFFNPNWMP